MSSVQGYDSYGGVCCRFPAIRKRFMTELKELRGRDQSPTTTNNIIGLLMGMKFFRIKVHTILSPYCMHIAAGQYEVSHIRPMTTTKFHC